MAFEMTCRVCRRLFEPTREDVIRGPATYRVCPACRPGDELAGSVVRANPEVRV